MIHAVVGSEALARRRKVQSLGTGLPHWSTNFLGTRSTEIRPEPQALLIEMNANETIVPHFHAVDQFQIFVAGSGTLGRNDASPVSVQYVDHHTAYGPLAAGPQGLSYFALRAQTDSGPVYLDAPDTRERLLPTKKRHRLANRLALSTEPVRLDRTSVALEPLLDEADGDDGLAAWLLRLGPDMTTTGPDPRAGAGLSVLVLAGSVEHTGTSYGLWSALAADREEPPLEICAGHQGLEAVLVRFPR